MRQLLAPTKAKIAVTGLILAMFLAADALASYAWILVALLDRDALRQMARSSAGARWAMQEALGPVPFGARAMIVQYLGDGIARVAVSYLAACAVLWLARDRPTATRPT